MAETRLTIRRSFPRLPAEVVSGFAGVPTGWVVDAQARRGALDHGIHRLFDAPAVVGSALPVLSAPRDNLAPYAALAFARPGDVLVIATGDYTGASVLGDVLAGMARNAGITAIVTDGMARDLAGLRAVGLPVYARGVSPNSPQKNGPGTVGLRVSLGGEAVEPGDLVVADEDGVVIVGRAEAAEVLARLEGIRAKEAQMEAAVGGGARAPAWLDAVLAGADVRFVDD